MACFDSISALIDRQRYEINLQSNLLGDLSHAWCLRYLKVKVGGVGCRAHADHQRCTSQERDPVQ